ncbi:hypothetical protein BC827DRAFT_93331 [Russula dissimulans]|nr:hypothetical protein BC827DRAFT_93331 [Russula dissimulans]
MCPDTSVAYIEPAFWSTFNVSEPLVSLFSPEPKDKGCSLNRMGCKQWTLKPRVQVPRVLVRYSALNSLPTSLHGTYEKTLRSIDEGKRIPQEYSSTINELAKVFTTHSPSLDYEINPPSTPTKPELPVPLNALGRALPARLLRFISERALNSPRASVVLQSLYLNFNPGTSLTVDVVSLTADIGQRRGG